MATARGQVGQVPPFDLAILVVLVVLAAVVAGCRPAQPSPADWRQQASLSLEDVSSEVATAELVLRAQTEQRLLGKAGVVMLVDAEEQVGSTLQDFTSLQPPAGLVQRHARVTDALEHASDLVTQVRSAHVRGDDAAYEDLLRALADERKSLTDLAGQVK